MKPRLKTFTGFVKSLLPAEITYLGSVAQFQDETNRMIFSHILKFKDTGRFKPDPEIDKRKYTYLKNWINRKLAAIDVDMMLDELLQLEKKVMTDQVMPADEKRILQILKHQGLPYYFMRIYELVRDYRSFLLVRMRHQYLEPVNRYLDQYHDKYETSRNTFEKLNLATRDIVDQYAGRDNNALEWEDFLKNIFHNETLDGLNRYYAIVRLTFLYYNSGQIEKSVELYNDLDHLLEQGHFYSRRILSNYYSNRLLVHARLNDLATAEKYGYLSIRDRGSDYIHYLNNLCSVLLRLHKNKEALELLQSSIPDLKKTQSYHNRVGFAALLIKSLSANGKAHEGESYGTTFFAAYREKVFEYRWHGFFSAWLQSMLMMEHYRRIITICRRYRIIDKEQEFSLRPWYYPTINLYFQLARYKTGEINLDFLKSKMDSMIQMTQRTDLQKEMIMEVGQHLPELMNRKIPS